MSENQGEKINGQSGGAACEKPEYELPEYIRLGGEDKNKTAFLKSAEGVRFGLLWLAAWLAGALLCEGVLRGGSGFGMAAACAALFACLLPFALTKDKKIKPAALIPASALLALEISFCTNGSYYGRGWLVLAAFGLFLMTAACASGCSDKSQLSVGGALDGVFACLLYPITNIGNSARAFKSRKRAGGGRLSGTAVKVLIGLVIAVPVALLLLLCFSCADGVFGTVINDFFTSLRNRFESDFLEDLGGYTADLLFGAFAALALVPMALTLRSGKTRPASGLSPKQPLDAVVCATVCFAAAAVYMLFIAVQFKYFFSVSLGYFLSPNGAIADPDFSSPIALPNDMSWSEYARSGFFELSGIIAATFIVIGLLIAFAKRRDNGRLPVVLKIALTLIAVCDLVLVVSAAMRMGLYTLWCGLTGKRAAVLAAVVFFALCVLAAIVRLWYEKLRLTRYVFAFALICVCFFGCMNIDRVCADYNVTRHLEQGTSVDMAYLGRLSCAAAPAVERLMNESSDSDISAAAKGILAKYKYYGDKPDSSSPLEDWRWGRHSADSLRAMRLCSKYALSEKDISEYYKLARYLTAKWSYEQQHEGETYKYSLEEYVREYAERCDDFTYYWYCGY